jgi:glutamine synthetase
LCPRQTLKRAVQKADDAGYKAFCGIEPEFIAMRWEDGQPVKAFDDDPLPGDGLRPRRQAFGYDVEYSIDSMEFLKELIDTVNDLGWEMKDVVCEGAYSQFELDFTYTDILQMADRLVFLRVLLKEVAKKYGMFITFMPKPTIGDWRSGAHINFSMTSNLDNKNVFEGKDGKFSDTAYHVVGGLLKHATEITAIACSTVNSYNGLVPIVGGFEGGVYTWAPTTMAYGDNNRSCMIRLPQNRFCIENRAADMCMNPYLSLALTTAAALDGIKNKIDPGDPLNINLYTLSPEEMKEANIKSLPRNLLEAIEALNEDDFAREVLGDSMLLQFFSYKKDEWDRYHQAVTNWEVEEFLRLY